MDLKEFEGMVQRALDELPGDFGKRLENIEVIVEDMPDMETAKSLKLGSKGRLLGLYQGVPLKARTHYYGMVMPDKITLFKSNIERTCQENDLDAYGEIKHVLEHEIAHHFGITDERLKDLGAY